MKRLWIVPMMFALISFPGQAQPQHAMALKPAKLHYENIDLPGAQETVANTINDRGEIVGGFIDFAGNSHGYLQVKTSRIE